MTKLPLINEVDQAYAQDFLKPWYDKNMIPAEKKPYLSDFESSVGPYMAVKTNSGPKYFLDAGSQIATLGHGFNPSIFSGLFHSFGSWGQNPKNKEFKEIRTAYESLIRRNLGFGKSIKFCHGGAEAVEIAMGIAFRRCGARPGQRPLAFKGSFHGRLQVSLSATWNPVKREIFEWPDSKVEYVSYPEIKTDQLDPEIPSNWREVWGQAVARNFSPQFKKVDEWIESEVQSLIEVRNQLKTGEIFAVIIEPMQCEGGDRFSSSRFHNGLINLCRSFQVPLIYDEVQTGFFLSSEMFWHRQFDLRNSGGERLYPDLVLGAKKSQIGYVVTDIADQSEEQFSTVSAHRGYIQALGMDQQRSKLQKSEKYIRGLNQKLTERFSEHIENPRNLGTAFAFDFKDPKKVTEFVSKRFHYGLLFYQAGSDTLRFRTNLAFKKEDINFLFSQLEKMGEEIFEGKTRMTPKEVETPHVIGSHDKDFHIDFLSKQKDLDFSNWIEKKARLLSPLQFVTIDKTNLDDFWPSILEIEKKNYEPTRQTEKSVFENSVKGKGFGIGILNESKKLIAISFCGHLKNFPQEKALRCDPMFSDEDCFYTIDTTVNKEYQGKGLGKSLKQVQLMKCLSLGVKRLSGRNRDQLAGSMMNLNLSLGAREVFYRKEDYLDLEEFRDVIYYSYPVREYKEDSLNLYDHATCPFSQNPVDVKDKEKLFFSTLNKVCISNFVSDDFMHGLDKIFSLAPKGLSHGYTTSGQSEGVDKIAKSIWYKKKASTRFLSFHNMNFGHASFISRSLRDDYENYFESDIFSFPTRENSSELLSSLEKSLTENEYLAVYIEPISSRDFRVVPKDFLKSLKALCQKSNVPLVYHESASMIYRYDSNQFFCAGDEELTPDALYFYMGGQAGAVMMKSEYFVEKPLMMISTWDGDEHSVRRFDDSLAKIEKNKKEYLDLRDQFDHKMGEFLKLYDLSHKVNSHGQGSFKGKIPVKWQDCFNQYGKDLWRYSCSVHTMKKFLEKSFD